VRIILNADDFGYSPDTVEATIDCFERGLLTSASLMPNMPATSRAITFALQRPQFSYGLHLTCTGDGEERPLSPPDEVPALVDESGAFLPTNLLRARAVLRRLPVEQIERELTAQLSLLAEAGLRITHVDSHRHLHKFAPFRQAFARTIERFGVRFVRNVQDVYLRVPLASPTYWLGHGWRRGLMAAFSTTDHFFMPTSAGDTDWHDRLLRAVAQLRGTSLEVGVHPGYEEPWRDEERQSLRRFVELARQSGHGLISWAELDATRSAE
jgi:chitin disaccharide deacetylase